MKILLFSLIIGAFACLVAFSQLIEDRFCLLLCFSDDDETKSDLVVMERRAVGSFLSSLIPVVLEWAWASTRQYSAAVIGGPLCPKSTRNLHRPDLDQDEQSNFNDERIGWNRRRRALEDELETTTIDDTNRAHYGLRAGMQTCNNHMECYPRGKVCCPASSDDFEDGKAGASLSGKPRYVCRAPRITIKKQAKGILIAPPRDQDD